MIVPCSLPVAVEFDLVILGGSPAARYAALSASRFQARIALVEPPGMPVFQPLYPAILSQLPPNLPPFTEPSVWAAEVVATQEEQLSLSHLASLGVDVIAATGHFSRQPRLSVRVEGRELRSRAYLLAPRTMTAIPPIEGLEKIGYQTPQTLWNTLESAKSPKTWAIVGGNSQAVELAQILYRLGKEVTLIAQSSQVLKREDPDIAKLLQASLEADGMTLITQAKVTQVKQIEGEKWLLAGNKAIETDEILLCSRPFPDVEGWNLAEAGVKLKKHGFKLNSKLQTTNPQIYALGGSSASFLQPHIAQAEAELILKNTLFFPWHSMDYSTFPTGIFSQPPVAQVGFTEAQAQEKFGKDFHILRHYYKGLSRAQMQGEITGFCKVLIRGNGEILGGAIVGREAMELIGAIAQAMQHKLKITDLAKYPAISSTLAEILPHTAAEWNHRRTYRRRDFWEGWFNFLRSWSRG